MLTAILLLFAVVLHGASSAVFCPYGYNNMFGTKCIGYPGTTTCTWGVCRVRCQNDGADLASIHSLEEDMAIVNGKPHYGYGYWFGLRCNETNRQKYWVDGTPVDYTNMGNDGCDNYQSYELFSDGSWQLMPTDYWVYPVCMMEGAADTGTACGIGYDLQDADQSCMRVITTTATWNQAEADCQTDSAHLVSIHSQTSNDFLRRTAVSNRMVDGVNIGFQMAGSDQTVTWSDGTPLDYTNYDSGMPNSIFGKCGLMQTRDLQGRWMSTECDQTQLPYICSKPQPCPANNEFQGQGEIFSPEYPGSKSRGIRCEYHITATAGKSVVLQFTELQLQNGDIVALYDGLTDTDPIAVLSRASPIDNFFSITGNAMKVVHLTGSETGARQWHATFSSN